MNPNAALALYDTPERLLAAVGRLRTHGFTLHAYTPHPVAGLFDALGAPPSRIPRWGLVGAVIGMLGGYLLQVWSMVWSYPFQVAGRPLHSWQSFVPVTFEMTVLGAALAIFAGVFWENRLPALHHPLFEYPAFLRSAIDRYVLLIFALPETEQDSHSLIQATGAEEVIAIVLPEGFRP